LYWRPLINEGIFSSDKIDRSTIQLVIPVAQPSAAQGSLPRIRKDDLHRGDVLKLKMMWSSPAYPVQSRPVPPAACAKSTTVLLLLLFFSR
jgi:hypothetical protein